MSSLQRERNGHKRRILFAAGLFLVIAIVIVGFLYRHYEFFNARVPKPVSGHIYPLTINGTLVYLTRAEKLPLDYAWVPPALFIAVGFVYLYKERREKHRSRLEG